MPKGSFVSLFPRYDYDDPVPNRQFEYLRTFLQESTAGPITATPWLKNVPPFNTIYRNIRLKKTLKFDRLNSATFFVPGRPWTSSG